MRRQPCRYLSGEHPRLQEGGVRLTGLRNRLKADGGKGMGQDGKAGPDEAGEVGRSQTCQPPWSMVRSLDFILREMEVTRGLIWTGLLVQFIF